jgi:hypothetical protein
LKQKNPGGCSGLRNTTFPGSGKIGLGPAAIERMTGLSTGYDVAAAVPERFFACGLKKAMQVL